MKIVLEDTIIQDLISNLNNKKTFLIFKERIEEIFEKNMHSEREHYITKLIE